METTKEYKTNTIAIISDGSAMAAAAAEAALPAMAEIAILCKEFGDVSAFPICLATQDAEEIINTVKNISPTFCGIDLEGIEAPKCFEVEQRLAEELDIPVFSGGGYGTAIVVCAAVINAFRLLGKPLAEVRAVVCGAGAAGNRIAKMLIKLGVRDIVVCDSKGILNASRIPEFGEDKLELIEITNIEGLSGGLEEAVKDRDLFVGVSKGGVLTESMVSSMAEGPVILALSSPVPEILPERAKAAGARIAMAGVAQDKGTVLLSSFADDDRTKEPSLCLFSNALAFPGVFKGAINAGIIKFNDEMYVAAAYAIAALVTDEELSEDMILPSVLLEGIAEAVAKAVAESATA